jgi:hypothetical protein
VNAWTPFKLTIRFAGSFAEFVELSTFYRRHARHAGEEQ